MSMEGCGFEEKKHRYKKHQGFGTLAFLDCMYEHFSMKMTEKIIHLAKNNFDEALIEEFLETFNRLSADSDIVDSILQISTDEGEELEVGFFTSDIIADITLSNGKVYSCTYPLSKVQSLNFADAVTKWTLTIVGDKKFDYNVVKPNSNNVLKEYEANLRRYLFLSSE